ncbi:S8/S53 family peptidase [Flavitalea sp.]|nr:S8/S53 family peptidase [Flavitalea sp.]
MPTHFNKLLIRTNSNSRDIDQSIGEQVNIPGREPISIVETLPSLANLWDDAHAVVSENPEIRFAEPEVNSSAPFFAYSEDAEERGSAIPVNQNEFIDYWPHPETPGVWHLGDEFSQLSKARAEIAAIPVRRVVRIAHLDTGYSAKHLSTPISLIRKDLERNFVDDEQDRWNNAEDPYSSGTLKMPGHGTGTLSILAGAKMAMPACDFEDYIGLYDQVEIVPIRIAASVVLLKSAAFVKALDYIVNELYPDAEKRVHIVTMSMGGVASGAWADLVNLAYEKGIFIVTAAGNNFNKLPARTMIFPARFNRVLAACGVTFDLSPYAKINGGSSFRVMEGNYGPKALMDTALAAFTPNVPWANYNHNNVVSIRGDGTSSATPQIAAAAALYHIKYFDELMALPEGWMRVEAIRHALFESAKKTMAGSSRDYRKYFGQGILQAADALKIQVASPQSLTKEKEDKVSFPLLKVIFGLRAIEDENYKEDEMLETELMQLVITDPILQNILDQEEKDAEDLDDKEQVRIADAVIDNPHASLKLKEKMQQILNQANFN